MIKNYVKIGWRNILRNKTGSFINIAGLATGMTCVILILLYIQDEFSYDKFLNQADHIYQVNMEGSENGSGFLTGNTAPAVGPAMVKEFPEVETYVRIYRPGDKIVQYEETGKAVNYFTEKNILAVDSNFLQLFSYQIKEGDPATCLNNPDALVITETTAKKYFGRTNPLGKIVMMGNEKMLLTVTAVLHDIPSASSLQFDMLMPVSAYPVVRRRSWNWSWLQVNTYVKLKDNVAGDKKGIEKLEAGFPAMVKQYAFVRNSVTFEQFKAKGGKMEYRLQPLTSVHLYAAGMGTAARLTTLGDIKYVRIFSVIAFFIIILACVNFMNLSTAQSTKRAKEVGVRKVLGSVKAQLIKQFLTEAMLYSFIATIIALLLTLLLLGSFNQIAGKNLGFSSLFANYLWLFVLGLTIVTGLLAGSYPAFYLTSFTPVTVLKGIKMFKSGLGAGFIRNGLVVFQFAVSTILIICTIVVFRQIRFTQQKNLGLNKENVVIISNGNRLGNGKETFRQEITKLPGVINAAVSSSIPSRVDFGDVYVPVPGGTTEQLMKEIGLSSFVVDYDFVPTLQIQLLSGRNFSNGFSDTASVIINETAVKQIGWKEPVGQYLEYPGNSQRFKVIGVAKDFNIESLRTPVAPFALFHSSSNTYDLGVSYVSVRLEPGNLVNSLDQMESKWEKFAPNTPFDYSFLDNDLAAQYDAEKRMGTVFGIFTILSILVACMGLFGLAAYTAERRIKEIGVRKVLGASVQGLVALLSKDFVKLVLLASVIAFPVAWWGMHKWLQDYAYRIQIGWWMFALAGAIALIIALMTVSFQAVKAAVANPVKSLRTE